MSQSIPLASSSAHVIWQPDTRRRPRSGKIEPREFDWICSLLPSLEVVHHFDGAFETHVPNPLVVLEGYDYDPEQVSQYLRSLKAKGHRVGLLHTGDEHNTAPLAPYAVADVVFRNYWRPDARHFAHCHYLPLGVNCPTDYLSRPPIEDRPYFWSFAGQRKPSRQSLIDVASTLSGGRLVVNEEFNSGLDKDQYGQLLSDTKIVLCPRGWSSVESYRLYEALEAGAIPLVEDDSGWGLVREHARPSALLNAVRGGPRYWMDLARRTTRPGSYWLTAYGPSFPCPRIYRWENLPALLHGLDVAAVSADVRAWWTTHRQALRKEVAHALQTQVNWPAAPAYTPQPVLPSQSRDL